MPFKNRQHTGTKARKIVLFLCTGNSCRSQMAEGWTRRLKNDFIETYSAGLEVHTLDDRAVKVMAEVGVDISNQWSKYVNELSDVQFDYVVTVCDNAHQACPLFSGGAKIVHAGFDDPPILAKTYQSEQEKLNCYRRVRDDIRNFIESLPETLEKINSN